MDEVNDGDAVDIHLIVRRLNEMLIFVLRDLFDIIHWIGYKSIKWTFIDGRIGYIYFTVWGLNNGINRGLDWLRTLPV